jgi:hypothetical protein
MKPHSARTAPCPPSTPTRHTPVNTSLKSFTGAALILLIVPLAFGSCTPTNQSPVDERPSALLDTTSTLPDHIDLSFDPLGAEGDITIVPEALRDSVTLRLSPLATDSILGIGATTSDSGAPGSESAPDIVVYDTVVYDTVAYDTYRIQLYNSRVYSEAALERSVATEIFDYTVTLDYEVPYFKVRLGDFPDAKVAAEYLKEYVKPAGYPDSWVARVRVTPQKSVEAQALLTAYFDSLRTAILMEGLDLETLDSLGVLDSLFADTLGDTTDIDEGDE